MTARLSTCDTCGGTIERRPGSVAGWGHVAETPRNADGHLPRPDDGAVSGPDRGDRDPCPGCGHPGHGEDGCEEQVTTGLYGSDGVPVYRWCPCTGSDPVCRLCGRVPAEGEAHRQVYGGGPDGDDVEEVCVGPDRHQLPYAPPPAPDPWLDPDAASAHQPPPF